MVGLTTTVPEADLHRFSGTLSRYTESLRGSAKRAIEKAAVKVAMALRSATKVSRKTRKVIPNPLRARLGKRQMEKSDKAHEHIRLWYETHDHKGTGRQIRWLRMETKENKPKWAAEKWNDGTVTARPIPGAKTKTEANQSKQRQIARSGLADKAWFWAMKDIGRGSAGKQGSDEVPESLRDRTMRVTRIFTADQSNLTIHNKLRYARQALTGGDPITAAMDRARKMMEFEMLDEAGKAAVKAGLRKIT